MTIYGTNDWEILKPVEATNLVENPSFETDSASYSAVGGTTLTRTTDEQAKGVFSLSVTGINAADDGVQIADIPITAGASYVASVYFKASQAGLSYELQAIGDVAAVRGFDNFTGQTYWQRASIAFEMGGSDSTLDIRFLTDQGTSHTLYVDGFVVEQATALSSYIDGDQEGCTWSGIPHQSKSTRSGKSRLGGEIINLNDEYDVVVQLPAGAGMPPVQLVNNRLGIADGALHQRTITEPRVFTLNGVVSGSDTNDFHYQRQRLIDLIKPDVTAAQDPFILRYTGVTGVTKQIECFYDGGLDFQRVSANNELFSMRLIAVSPYWAEDTDEGVSLTDVSEITGNRIFVRDSDGAWSGAAGGINQGKVNHLAWREGELYVGGCFTTVGTASQTANGFAKFNPSACSWTTFSEGLKTSGSDAAEVFDFGFKPGGAITVVGDFNTAGSVEATLVADWTGNQWVGFGTGVNTGVINAVHVNASNAVFVAGTITSLHGDGVVRAASWDGFNWETIGDGFAAEVGDITQDVSGSLYATGAFEASGSVTASRIAVYDRVQNEWAQLGDGLDASGLALSFATATGLLYAAGDFTQTGTCTITACKVIQWNGTGFSALGNGVQGQNAAITAMEFEETRSLLHVAGAKITAIGNNVIGGTAGSTQAGTWTGGDWVRFPILLDDATITAIAAGSNGELAIGLAGVEVASAVNPQSVSNSGTATAFPTIKVSGCGVFYEIENLTADTRLITQIDLAASETLTFDLERKEYRSDFRGNLLNFLHPGSNLTSWRLLPGVNQVSVANIDTASVVLFWRKRHWAIDGGAS